MKKRTQPAAQPSRWRMRQQQSIVCTSSRQSQATAFTLVELLVVIGIIAVLIGVLLPALARARQAAQSAQCLSNLRQMCVASINFANDHKGYMQTVTSDSTS